MLKQHHTRELALKPTREIISAQTSHKHNINKGPESTMVNLTQRLFTTLVEFVYHVPGGWGGGGGGGCVSSSQAFEQVHRCFYNAYYIRVLLLPKTHEEKLTSGKSGFKLKNKQKTCGETNINVC